MAPLEDDAERNAGDKLPPRQDSARAGSGDVQLEAEITKLRSSILRTVIELDRFSESVRLARGRVEQMAALPKDPEHADSE
jgi:hypothetical protein